VTEIPSRFCVRCGAPRVPDVEACQKCGASDLPTEITAAATEAGASLWFVRLIFAAFLAATPFAVLAAIRGSGGNRAFFISWTVLVVSSAYAARNFCDEITLSETGITFRCVRGTVTIPIAHVFAVIDEPVWLVGSGRAFVFVTSRGSFSTPFWKLNGMDALIDALARARPSVRQFGPNKDQSSLLDSPEAIWFARRMFYTGIILSIGWTACGVAGLVLGTDSGRAVALVGAGYALVALLALAVAPLRLGLSGGVSSPDTGHFGPRSEQVVRYGLLAHGLSASWATTVRTVLLAAPLIPWMVKTFTSG
jgi:hypothetical protein